MVQRLVKCSLVGNFEITSQMYTSIFCLDCFNQQDLMSDTKLRLTDALIGLKTETKREFRKGVGSVCVCIHTYSVYFCVISKTFPLVYFSNDHFLHSNLCLTHSQTKSF